MLGKAIADTAKVDDVMLAQRGKKNIDELFNFFFSFSRTSHRLIVMLLLRGEGVGQAEAVARFT